MSLCFSFKKRYEGFTLDVGLELGEELLVLFGPSGAGKSLTLKMISGLVKPDEGVVTMAGEPVFDSGAGLNTPIRKCRTGYLFQDYALFPHMTVSQNIAYGIRGLVRAETEARVGELIGVMRLAGLEGRYPAELSGGQKQRTALARTLATGPRVLLLDEPFSALDYQVREKLRADLLNIHRIFPITTIVVTHDLEEAFMLSSRIAVINEGRIEQFGSREEVFYRPATRNVARFVGTRNIFRGRVKEVRAGRVVIESPDLGVILAHSTCAPALKAGREVSFCIRPEEIPVIRKDKVLDPRVSDNLLECEISSTIAKGTTHILFLKVGTGSALLKVELPNFVLRKLGLAIGERIRVSLKKESVWIIP